MSETSDSAATHHATQQALLSLSDCIDDSKVAQQALRAVADLMLHDTPDGGKKTLNNVERGGLLALLGIISDRMATDTNRIQAAAEEASLTL